MEGYGDGADKYLVHHQGGGWCFSISSCLERAYGDKHTFLGSSTQWVSKSNCVDPLYVKKNNDHIHDKSHPCFTDGGSKGMFSSSKDVNPIMYNWNKVCT